MYKGCYQLLSGGNPVTVQALLGNKDYSQLRRRVLVKVVSLCVVLAVSYYWCSTTGSRVCPRYLDSTKNYCCLELLCTYCVAEHSALLFVVCILYYFLEINCYTSKLEHV